jgi:prophage regulatory protein
MREVIALTTYSRASIYRLIARGEFPRPIKIGALKIAFRERDILKWLDSREGSR